MSEPRQKVETRLSQDEADAIAERLRWARAEEVARRVYERDHTLWAPEPDEISDRLGWLDVADQMLGSVEALESFVADVRAAGFTHCVLLGMGGSSLGPEVLRQSFGVREGFLELHVLDSTHPDQVTAVADAVPLQRTLFLVSSKSGGTLEPNAFYAYFRGRVDDPSRFVAITDPDTKLAALALEQGFRHTWVNPPDIGGRYSVLSYFGLVPAALMGVDVRAVLERANEAAAEEAQGVELGLALGELARRGSDKLTFLVDEPLGSFGLWVEQLVAESTGKHGRGIVPVADEPLGPPGVYGGDRVFAHLRRDGQEPPPGLADLDAPVFTLPFADPRDLGALFFTWELAVAVAGAVLEINAFDQPNVQEAKDLTVTTIDAFKQRGGFEPEDPDARDGDLAAFGAPGADSVAAALTRFLDDAGPGRYVATMAYLPYGPEMDAALTELRLALRDSRRVATTVGYGPRFLHSTGQLHKGGPAEGLFLQLTNDGSLGVEIPGFGYAFDALVRAQAIGDLEALRSRDLPALRIHLSGDPVAGVARLAQLARDQRRNH